MKMQSIILAAGAIALGTGLANARTVVVTAEPLPFERVSFADLDVASTAGQTTLKNRIRGAARRVCIIDGDPSLRNQVDGYRCFRASVSDGMEQMNHVIAARASGSTVAATALTISAK